MSNHFVEIKSDNKTLIQLIQAQAEKYPHKIAIRYKKTSISYEQLMLSVELYTASLCTYGAAPGQVIALAFKHHPDALISMLACLNLNCIYLPVPENSSREYLDYLLNDSQAQLVLTNRYTNSLICDLESIAGARIIFTMIFLTLM